MALGHTEDNYLSNWNNAVAYVSSKMSKVFPTNEKGKFAKTCRA